MEMGTWYNYFVILLFLVPMAGHGQIDPGWYPEQGVLVPDFTLHPIENYSVKEISSEALRGKHVILAFWNRTCSGSFSMLKKLDAFHKKYKGQAEIIAVGGRTRQREYNIQMEIKQLKDYYAKVDDLYDLTLPVVFDPILFKRFVVEGAPYLVWIDPAGIVRAVTGTLNDSWIKAFLKGESFVYGDLSYSALHHEEIRPDRYDSHKPFLADNNGGESDRFEYRSLLTPYQNGMPRGPILNYTLYKPHDKIEGVAGLENLYRLAYFGYYWNYETWPGDENYKHVILKVKDTSAFKDFSMYGDRRNAYWYSLILPEGRREIHREMEILRQDLDRYFDYTARIELKSMPYWSVRANPKAILKYKTKGEASEILGDQFMSLGIVNTSVDEYLKTLFYIIAAGGSKELPIVNETGIDFALDIPVTIGDRSDFESLKKVLTSQGFKIEKKTRKFRVLVISDKESM